MASKGGGIYPGLCGLLEAKEGPPAGTRETTRPKGQVAPGDLW